VTFHGGSVPPAAFTRSARRGEAPLIRAAFIALALGGAIGGRWASAGAPIADGIAVGVSFGVVLLVAAAVAGWRPTVLPTRLLARRGAIGLGGGAVLVALALATRWPGPWLPLHPAGAFAVWAVATTLVATAEEVVLRGVLFDAVDQARGPAAAIVATSVAFALLHVPLYGWHVVPLDLGVGVFLGGLRLGTGGIVAPAAAHVVADLVTWWI
jgi:membrane protease YdiL (CAAX protease family)